jgi:hypothetical protein
MLDYDDIEIYKILVEVSKDFGIDPSVSLESEVFFRELLNGYDGLFNKKDITTWLQLKLSEKFIALRERPKWIQSANWPFHNGNPMVFVGQIDLSIVQDEISRIYHDDTSLFIFISRGSPPVIIVQQY